MSFLSNGVELMTQFTFRQNDPIDGRYVIVSTEEYDALMSFLYPGLVFTVTTDLEWKDKDSEKITKAVKAGHYRVKVDGKTIEDAGISTENTIILAEDLYTYVPIGKAQKASNEIIGSGADICDTNRGKLASAGDSLKAVFDKVFGVETDQNPTISTSNVKLSVTTGTKEYGNSTEVGTTVPRTDVAITFALSNSGTANYGYRCGETSYKTTTFYYPVTKQSDADIKITLPSTVTASKDLLTNKDLFVKAEGSNLYCNLDDENAVTISISLSEGKVTATKQIRYASISASVSLGDAQDASGNTITKFLTFLGQDYSDSGTYLSYSAEEVSKATGDYIIAPGEKYVYYATTADANEPSSWSLYKSGQTSVEDLSIDAKAGQYVWIASTSSYKYLRLFNDASGSYNGVDALTSKSSAKSLTNSKGVDATGYYFYSTGPRKVTGPAKLKLSNSLTDY